MSALRPETERAAEELWALRREAVRLLGLVVAEWSSDPQSVQCFDLRIVSKATVVVRRVAELERKLGGLF